MKIVGKGELFGDNNEYSNVKIATYPNGKYVEKTISYSEWKKTHPNLYKLGKKIWENKTSINTIFKEL